MTGVRLEPARKAQSTCRQTQAPEQAFTLIGGRWKHACHMCMHMHMHMYMCMLVNI